MNPKLDAYEVAAYDDKIEYIRVVAQRGADARTLFDDSGQRLPLFGRSTRATQVYEALAVTRPCGPNGAVHALADTPTDDPGGVSWRWSAHVRGVRRVLSGRCAAARSAE
ncbi:hypothetical protein ADK67_15000 [Saccharothrix sp. NRRL B-16348]|uniref:hypothetical protein n=1 Tax=Saccharothrix sp. NRRL B-16348 TaxID=1415542 RepID=UPI0006ADE4A3|nr:hypothetical protein [Saccharothrix sp. NRRL B-16348]KOX27115.1 hypothetical protein ADK67_15000 [Saccharothrix sp. NRRL B-16348]